MLRLSIDGVPDSSDPDRLNGISVFLTVPGQAGGKLRQDQPAWLSGNHRSSNTRRVRYSNGLRNRHLCSCRRRQPPPRRFPLRRHRLLRPPPSTIMYGPYLSVRAFTPVTSQFPDGNSAGFEVSSPWPLVCRLDSAVGMKGAFFVSTTRLCTSISYTSFGGILPSLASYSLSTTSTLSFVLAALSTIRTSPPPDPAAFLNAERDDECRERRKWIKMPAAGGSAQFRCGRGGCGFHPGQEQECPEQGEGDVRRARAKARASFTLYVHLCLLSYSTPRLGVPIQ